MGDLYWVKNEGDPWWPAQVLPDSDGPEGFTKVQYFGPTDDQGYGQAGYVNLADSSTVVPFDPADEEKMSTEDEALRRAITDAVSTLQYRQAVEQKESARAARKAEKAHRKQVKASKKEKHTAAQRSPSRSSALGAVRKRLATTEELLQAKARLDNLLSDPATRDETLVTQLRPLSHVQVTAQQLLSTRVGQLLAEVVADNSRPHAAALAAGLLQFWFMMLDDSVKAKLAKS